MSTPVLLSLPGPIETPIVEALNRSADFTVERRCADVAELLAASAAGLGELCIVHGSQLGITREVVDRLHRAHVVVLALANREDLERVAALGCDAVMVVGSEIPEILKALRKLATRSVQKASGSPGPEAVGPTELPGDHELVPHTPLSDMREEGSQNTGTVIAVWGTRGAPGRTTVAANLARLLSEIGPTCLIDADTRAPSLAPILGIVEDASGIAAAARLASSGRLDTDGLIRACRQMGAVSILTGITRPDRWREIPSSALDAVLFKCRSIFSFTVVDVPGGWEESSSDGAFGPSRDGALVAALTAADSVVIVGAADPVGVWRLIELMAVRPRFDAREIVVVTKSRPSVVGPGSHHAVAEALTRYAGVNNAIVIPDDRPGLDNALLSGAFLVDVAATSPVLGGLWELADRVTDGQALATRRAIRSRQKKTRKAP